ncbi:MAG: ArsR/SmtB family transcription factor [Flammeovirgaceae bacterium]
MSQSKAPEFEATLQEVAKIAKVLAHPARLAILQHLAKAKTCISGDIVNELPLSRTTVSQHLKELRKLGLIKSKVEGVTVSYCIDNEKLDEANQLLTSFLLNTRQEIFCDC